ncbi:MAG: ABC transporter permease [Candidatus Promineifilaceae bacterium]|nr:ABC transporter permease [Candidatus Promineifilaceae bacterium]
MAVAELSPQEGAPEVRRERSLFEESLVRLFKNRVAVGSMIFIALLVIVAIFPQLVTNADPIRQDLLQTNAVPEWMLPIMPENAENYAKFSSEYVLGADNLGRDLWARTIYGARVSLAVAFVASAVSLIVGTVYGSISGYLGGKVDNVMMRIVDFLYGFPFLIVVILLQAYFKALARRGSGDVGGIGGTVVRLNNQMGGMLFLFIAIGLINWLALARIARGQVLSYKEKEFVEAARSIGASDTRIMFKHLLPNIMGPLIVAETLAIPGYIFTEAFLSFIGLGVNPPTPSWGIMISEAVQGLRSYPNQIIVPAVMLSVTTLAFNFLGDGLRDAFDPRLKE